MRRVAPRSLQAACAALVLLLGVAALVATVAHDPAPSRDASAHPATRDFRRGHDDVALRSAAPLDARASATGHGSHADLLAVLAAAGACTALLLGWWGATRVPHAHLGRWAHRLGARGPPRLALS